MGRLFTRQARGRKQRDELLSAYLDGQLSTGERARLEARLATDSALEAELEALRHTVALVHDLPPTPIPRNFILPQTIAARPRPMPSKGHRSAWAAPLLTAATAVVSLLFVVVLAGDLLLSGTGRVAFAPAGERMMEAEAPQAALAPSQVSEEVTVEVEVEAEVKAETEEVIPAATPLPMPMEAPPEAIPEATAEAEHYAARTPEDVETTVAEEAAIAPTAPATPEGTLSPDQAMGGGQIEEPTVPAPTPSPSVAEEAAATPTSPATATAVPERNVGGIGPTPSEVAEVAPWAIGEEEPKAAESGRGAPEGEVVGVAAISPWRVLEAILGLVTLGLVLVTVWAWRVRRR